MKRLGPIGTRRQLLRVTASFPFLALARNPAWAQTRPAPAPSPTPAPRPTNSCFLKSTKISTPLGDRLVQELQIGDEVQTLTGRKTIKWIGYNKFTKEEGRAWQDSVMPIRVARFAIDDRTPYCDLYVSPWHCIFFNEALIPVMYLINETSIAQRAPSDMSAIEYYHIDLGTHEVIYAEGASVDSYFDNGSNRESFSNFVEYERLYGVQHQFKMTPFVSTKRSRTPRSAISISYSAAPDRSIHRRFDQWSRIRSARCMGERLHDQVATG